MCDTRSRYQIHVADKTRPPSRMPTCSRAGAITKVRIRKVRPQRVLEGAGLCRENAATTGHPLGRSWAGAGRARRVCNVGHPARSEMRGARSTSNRGHCVFFASGLPPISEFEISTKPRTASRDEKTNDGRPNLAVGVSGAKGASLLI